MKTNSQSADDSTFDYHRELNRRISQFTGYLKKMYHRAHEEVHGPCFIIFEERRPLADSGGMKLVEAAKPALELAVAVVEDVGISNISMSDELFDVGFRDEGWREDDSINRYIQFSVEKNWFCMDMPLQTLFLPEAEQILQSRKGFFYLRDRPAFTLYGEDVDGYDPFRKVYLYGDEVSAAEDMAFIFFQVWRFPLNWRFFVTADAFGDKESDWERGVPFE
jgi:hypothetical protein